MDIKTQKRSRRAAFIGLYRPYKGWLMADMLCAMLCAAIGLVMPLLIRTVTVSAENGTFQLDLLWQTGAIMVGLLILWTGCEYFYDAMGHVMGAKMERDMRRNMFAKYLRLPILFYDHEKTGKLMSRLTGDTNSIAELFHHGPEDFIIFTLQFVGALVVLFHMNAALTWSVLALLPVILLLNWIFQRKLRTAYTRNREIMADVNAQVEDTLSGIRVVKAFRSEGQEQEKFGRENERFLASRKDIYKKEAYYYTVLGTFFGQLIPIVVIMLGGLLISRQQLSLSDVITFLLYIGYLTAPIKGLSNTVRLYQEGLSGFARYMEIMEQPEEAQLALPTGEAVTRGEIVYEDVHFRYGPDQPEVLRGVSLRIAPGECVALVGSSGVGKTTLCALLPRFYDICEGRIAIDGEDIQGLPLDVLRKGIGMVQQDVYLFDGTVLENLRYGMPDAGQAQIEEAARLAGAHDFIMGLPDGYDTFVGQRGVRLSGGQKQRISIARIFLVNPPVLIFDEATSSLDQENEQVVLKSLDRLSKGRTTLIIAHRLSTVRHAQRIVVLEDGRVQEEGTHEQLMGAGGRYARMCQAGDVMDTGMEEDRP